MTNKHTPGPWVAHSLMVSEAGQPVGRGRDICHCGIGMRLPSDGQQSMSNARLIAAAPEMLEALIQAAAHLSSGIQTNQGSHDDPPEPASQWDYEAGLMAGDLLRLVAKATGEGA